MTPNQRSRGFTLIELMIVVLIVGTLAAIGYPSYRTHVLKGNRAAAQAFLMDASLRQQQYFLDNRAYAPDLGTIFGTAGASIPSEVSPYYTITVATTAGPPPTFLLTAVPKGNQIASTESTLTIDQTGAKTPSSAW
jgi:type IV pilus assembly protein PilE